MTQEESKKIYRNGPTAGEMGEFYSRHAMAMTAEQLYSKSEIAMELGFRDMRIEELLAAVKQLRDERQWQPIETAPMDGREILTLNARGDMHLIFWHEENGWEHSFYHGFSVHTPILWMPLPDVPQDFINDRIEKGRR